MKRTQHSQRFKNQVPYAPGEAAREILAWSFPAESSKKNGISMGIEKVRTPG
jgi:hypothetical protein